MIQAVSYQQGTGVQTQPDPGREYDFHYHSGTDDYHFYGTDAWAVRFDFREVYPSQVNSEFNVSQAMIFLPQLVDSVRVELFNDSQGAPGSSLTWAKVPVSDYQTVIDFPVSVQEDTLWLVVYYQTNFSTRFVSASEGGGTHSYFWNTNLQNPYWQSFFGAGFNAELLFGLGGDFVLDNPDLELVSFDLTGNIHPRETVGPTFSVYNHSDQAVTGAVLGFNVYSPDPQFAFYDEILIPGELAPRSLYVWDSQSPGFTDHQFDLPANPLQIKLRAALTSPLQDNDPQANNVRLIHRFSFTELFPIYLTENFLRYPDLDTVTAIQDQYSFPQQHMLNFFPILSDSLGNVPAQIRYNWYQFNSLPRTVIGGDLRINGFAANYISLYDQLCTQVQTQRTFVTTSNCRLNYIQQNDLLSAELTLTNANTMLYTSATEYNLVGNSLLHLGLFKRVMLDGTDRWVIDRWISHAGPITGTLNAGESYITSFNIPLNNLTLAELSQNYRLYYWLQLEDGGRILFSAWTDFSGIVANNDCWISPPRLRADPTPLRPGSKMSVTLGGGEIIAHLQIYNIRGQKLLDSPLPVRTMELTTDLFPASGVYLLRVRQLGGQNRRWLQTKINVIK